MSEEIEIAKQWLAKARSDLLSADNNLAAEQTPCDAVCFHCQQAAEKLLKAFLVASRRPFPFTHDLLLILEGVLPLDRGAERLRDPLAVLIPYAVAIRYPDDWHMPSMQDAREAREAAGQVMEWLREAMPELLGDAR